MLAGTKETVQPQMETRVRSLPFLLVLKALTKHLYVHSLLCLFEASHRPGTQTSPPPAFMNAMDPQNSADTAVPTLSPQHCTCLEKPLCTELRLRKDERYGNEADGAEPAARLFSCEEIKKYDSAAALTQIVCLAEK